MSPSEFAFLAGGLVLGLLAGGAFVEVIRARPAARREVRVTVSAGPAGGRAATLATPLLASELVPHGDDVFAPEAGPAERPFGPVTPDPAREVAPEAAPAVRDGPGTPRVEPVDPCAALRAVADEASAHAERMAAVAGAAQERARNARRAYDDHAGRRERAAATIDPRVIRAAKDEAQAQFRRGRLAGRDRAAVEAAAAAWLREINRINARSREAALVVSREAEVESELLREVDKAALDADVARIRSEHAAEAHRDCADRAWPAARRPSAWGLSVVWRPDRRRRASSGRRTTRSPEVPVAAGGDVPILRLLQGDRATMRSIVERLAGSDQDDQRRWQLLLSDLVDAITARAIDASALSFPEDHVFWGPYTQSQCREIATAMAALGYRFDGLGGFADGRVPGLRDLSLALAYAGQDPMRVRHWPTEVADACPLRQRPG